MQYRGSCREFGGCKLRTIKIISQLKAATRQFDRYTNSISVRFDPQYRIFRAYTEHDLASVVIPARPFAIGNHGYITVAIVAQAPECAMIDCDRCSGDRFDSFKYTLQLHKHHFKHRIGYLGIEVLIGRDDSAGFQHRSD